MNKRIKNFLHTNLIQTLKTQNKKVLIFFAVCGIAVSFFFNACSTTPELAQCESFDWYNMGFVVGQKGEVLNLNDSEYKCLRSYKSAMKKEKSRIEAGFNDGLRNFCDPSKAYYKGRTGQKLDVKKCNKALHAQLASEYAKGLEYFCTPEKGFALGANGTPYEKGTCPQEKEITFLKEYALGKQALSNNSASQTFR